MAVSTNRGLRVCSVGLAAGALALVGCATPPPPALEEARAAYEEASADPAVTSKAPVPLYEAKKSLDRAERAWERDDETEALHRAGLAQTRVEIARVTAQGEEARARSRELSKEREKVLLEARTAEVGAARSVAEREAERAERESERARELARTVEELQSKESERVQAEETERGMVLTLGDVLFDFNQATLRPGAAATLDRVARFLRENSERELLIEGHTDSVGSETYNQGLSQRRAETVARHLERRGVDPGRVVARGYGESLPIVSNDSQAGRQQNRRVEIVILDPGESALRAARRRASDLPAVGAAPPQQQQQSEQEPKREPEQQPEQRRQQESAQQPEQRRQQESAQQPEQQPDQEPTQEPAQQPDQGRQPEPAQQTPEQERQQEPTQEPEQRSEQE